MTEICSAVAGIDIAKNERYAIPVSFFILTIVTDDFMEKTDILSEDEDGIAKYNALMEHIYSKDSQSLEDIPDGLLPSGLRPAARAFFDLKDRSRRLNEAEPDAQTGLPGLDFNESSESMNCLRALAILQLEKRRLQGLPEGTFRFLRSYDGCGVALLGCSASLLKQALPPSVLTHLYYRRFMDVFGSLTAICNDVIGLKKEMESGSRVNLILFRAVKKGISVPVALKQTLEQLAEEVEEMEFLVDRLTNLFPDVEELDKTIETARRIIDGYGFFGCKYNSERYGVVDYKLIH
jgi:hypothetical protein